MGRWFKREMREQKGKTQEKTVKKKNEVQVQWRFSFLPFTWRGFIFHLSSDFLDPNRSSPVVLDFAKASKTPYPVQVPYFLPISEFVVD